jgi:hypothetical protein
MACFIFVLQAVIWLPWVAQWKGLQIGWQNEYIE